MALNTSVTAADIARIAQVSRTMVSNWRRRHEDFPEPIGGSGHRALFNLAQIEQWLADSDRMPEHAFHEHVWERVWAAAAERGDLIQVVADVQELLLHLSRGEVLPGQNMQKATDRVCAFPGGADLAKALREAVTTPTTARELSGHLHQAYLEALGGKAHLTPKPLAHLMVDLVDVRGAKVLDPACGTGSLLRTASENGAVGLYGQEIEPATARLTQALVGLVPSSAHGQVVGGNSLTATPFAIANSTRCCATHLSTSATGAQTNSLTTNAGPTGCRSESELAWVQHCLAHTAPAAGSSYSCPRRPRPASRAAASAGNYCAGACSRPSSGFRSVQRCPCTWDCTCGCWNDPTRKRPSNSKCSSSTPKTIGRKAKSAERPHGRNYARGWFRPGARSSKRPESPTVRWTRPGSAGPCPWSSCWTRAWT